MTRDISMGASMAPQRFSILDPLRLIAAFAVVFYHYLPFVNGTLIGNALNPFKYGYLGVNFFFMLSGFVIMASCQSRGALQFAFARALRIYPAFISCLLITVMIVYLVAGKTFQPLQILSNAFIVNDYIGQENIDGVYWTLQAELKFYACIFMLSLSGLLKYWRTWLSIWLVTAISYHFIGQPFFLGWFISPAYSFYFIGGVSAYLLSQNTKDKFVLGVFVIALIFSCIKSSMQVAGFVGDAIQFDKYIAASVVFVFFIFFYFLALGKLHIEKKPYWLLMGAISYPIYLMHNRAGKTVFGFFDGVGGTYFSFVSTIVLITIVSLFVHLYVERKIFSFFKRRA